MGKRVGSAAGSCSVSLQMCISSLLNPTTALLKHELFYIVSLSWSCIASPATDNKRNVSFLSHPQLSIPYMFLRAAENTSAFSALLCKSVMVELHL